MNHLHHDLVNDLESHKGIADLWSCIQMVKLHYGAGSILKSEYIHILGKYYEEATR